MATLEHRLQRLEQGRPSPLIVLIKSLCGTIDDPVHISLSGGSQQWLREDGESVDAFRRRALSGPHAAGAAAVVVLCERNGIEVGSTDNAAEGDCR